MNQIAVAMRAEIERLRKLFGDTQKSVSMNFCCVEVITGPNIEIRTTLIKLTASNGEKKEFYFGHIFNGVGEELKCMEPLLNAFMSVDNACIMLHGRTGSGKSRSMYGSMHHLESFPSRNKSIYYEIRPKCCIALT